MSVVTLDQTLGRPTCGLRDELPAKAQDGKVRLSHRTGIKKRAAASVIFVFANIEHRWNLVPSDFLWAEPRAGEGIVLVRGILLCHSGRRAA